MSQTITKYIKNIDAALNQNKITVPQVDHVMSQFRHIIEAEGLQEKYKYLNLYCNWNAHTQISQSKTAFRIFEFLVESFCNHQNNPNTAQWIGDAIIEGLSLHKLWDEIKQISKDYNISSYRILSDSNNWVHFGTKLLEYLCGKPLKFPDGIESETKNTDTKKFFDRIRAKANSTFGKDQFAIMSIAFIPNPEFSGSYLCEIKTLANKNIVTHAPVAFRTQEMIDRARNKTT